MAYLEHICRECWLVWLDNSLSLRCPECGSMNTARHLDEQSLWEPHEDEGEYEEDDDDD